MESINVPQSAKHKSYAANPSITGNDLDRYTYDKEKDKLGEGTYGVVYKAIDRIKGTVIKFYLTASLDCSLEENKTRKRR